MQFRDKIMSHCSRGPCGSRNENFMCKRVGAKLFLWVPRDGTVLLNIFCKLLKKDVLGNGV